MGSSFAASATLLLVAVVVLFLAGGAAAEPLEDKKALMDFIANIPHRPLNWNSSSSACTTWVGITCDSEESRVIAVRLPGAALSGRIPPNTLSRLSALQTLSLRSNGLSGPFPPDFVYLTSLIDLHLQSNGFSGPLPADFSSWRNLTALDLSFNRLNGSIPDSVSNASRLVSLDLANNNLSGEIPSLQLPDLTYLNLSNNHLQGPIPKSLQKFSGSSFSGNNLTTLAPTPPSPPPSPPPSQRPLLQSSPPPTLSPHATKSSKRIFNQSAVLGIIVGGCALLFAVIAVLLILCFSRRRKENVTSGKMGKGDRSPEKAATADQDENNRLVFFEGCTFAFDLEDLLRASAEVLGKGTFGTAYKAALEDSTTLVVKRLKDVGVGKREFEQQMEVVGRIKHENVVELRAYYYSKDEKLLVYDHHSLGSVSAMIHGRRGEDRTPLDWESRLKIALGAARGIAHVHAENNGRLVHGNIKSSNVFLNHQFYGCVSDIGLTTLMNPMISPVSRTAGYRAPEVTDSRKATQMSDVYSFGVLLLELLTGKSPIQVIGGGDEIIHLVRWVQSVVREEWTGEVFDVELMRYQNVEEEMVEMLQIAMSCVVRNPDHRPQMAEVLKRIQDVRREGTGGASSDVETGAPTPTQVQASTAYVVEPSNHN